jgi:hypothetical protein
MRFSDERLQAESSTCMYSEHGFDALMRPEFGDVCHSLIDRVVLDAGIRALPRRVGDLAHELARVDRLPIGSPVERARRCPASPFSTARMNSSVQRTELFAFWYWIDFIPSPSSDMSKPALAARGPCPPPWPCTR